MPATQASQCAEACIDDWAPGARHVGLGQCAEACVDDRAPGASHVGPGQCAKACVDDRAPGAMRRGSMDDRAPGASHVLCMAHGQSGLRLTDAADCGCAEPECRRLLPLSAWPDAQRSACAAAYAADDSPASSRCSRAFMTRLAPVHALCWSVAWRRAESGAQRSACHLPAVIAPVTCQQSLHQCMHCVGASHGAVQMQVLSDRPVSCQQSLHQCMHCVGASHGAVQMQVLSDRPVSCQQSLHQCMHCVGASHGATSCRLLMPCTVM
ncbi:hypothetical protein COO60DRAFT_624175 [Scenedesmus sp. NREL 46B-D3]|nr:hypothetical protein COO60DRAFT_624175 [Scenedesmus sp. NREL 46B-D3]